MVLLPIQYLICCSDENVRDFKGKSTKCLYPIYFLSVLMVFRIFNGLSIEANFNYSTVVAFPKLQKLPQFSYNNLLILLTPVIIFVRIDNS
jgi:hypothetical protein